MDHLGGSVLQRLIERPRIADGEDVVRVLAAGPAYCLPFAQIHRELNLE